MNRTCYVYHGELNEKLYDRPMRQYLYQKYAKCQKAGKKKKAAQPYTSPTQSQESHQLIRHVTLSNLRVMIHHRL